MKIFILEQRLLDYRIPIYKKLNQEKDLNVVLYYWHNYTDKDFLNSLSPNSIDFRVNGIKIISIFNKLFLPLYPLFIFIINKPNILIIRGNVRNILIIPLLLFRKLFGFRTIVWGQGCSRKRHFNPSSNIFDIIPFIQLKLSDASLVYDDLTKNKLNSYFPNKIFVAKNTLDFDLEEIYYNKISNEKIKLDFTAKINLCFVGRLSERKRIPRLVELFDLVLGIEPNANLWIIGDGPKSSFVQEKASKNSKIKYLGPLYGIDASRVLYHCDATLMPGWMGLGVNHSLYYGSPVFSELFNNSLLHHAPESSFIIDNYNGFLNEAGEDESFINNFKVFLKSKSIYSNNARQYALEKLKPTHMLDGIKNAINHINT